MAEKQSNKDRLREITASIENGIRELFQSEKYMQYLTTMSRFHKYSVNNQMLIFLQNPNATLVAGFNRWKNHFGRNVKRGERGIKIIAPTPYKKKIEKEKLDPDTKLPILDEDGKVIMEEKTVQIPMYKPVTVFDVSQTEGRPLPQLAESLTGTVENYEVFMEAIKRSSPVPVTVMPLAANLDGFFDPEHQSITLRDGMSEVQTVCAAIHEIAHAVLHDPNKPEPVPSWNVVMVSEGGTRHSYSQGFTTVEEAEQFAEKEGWRYVDENQFEWRLEVEEDQSPLIQQAKGRHTEEVQAESISFSVCAFYNIDTGANSFGYIGSWSKGKDLPELRASLEVINKTSGSLIEAIDKHYREICAERGIDLSSKTEQEQSSGMVAQQPDAEPAQLPDAPEQLLDVYPLPDQDLSEGDLAKAGYLDGDLLPLTKERAYEMMERDLTVYIIREGENPEMALDAADLDAHDGIFALARDEWEQSPLFHDKVMERQDKQPEREQAFLSHPGDCYAIYQVARDAPQNIRFMNMEWLQSHGIPVDRASYDLVYTAPLAVVHSTEETLEQLYRRFNADKPADFHSPSMSVSDIVALKQNGVVSCHYVDSVGFQQVPGFLPDNPLKSAELSLEDDYGMIDGVINNGKKEEALPKSQAPELSALFAAAKETMQRETSRSVDGKKRESVLARLQAPVPPRSEKTAPQKSAERDLL